MDDKSQLNCVARGEMIQNNSHKRYKYSPYQLNELVPFIDRNKHLNWHTSTD